jgi:hypothetical protein
MRKSEVYRPCGYHEEDFWMHPSLDVAFLKLTPLEENLIIYLNKFEFRLPKNDLYQIWFRLAHWF